MVKITTSYDVVLYGTHVAVVTRSPSSRLTGRLGWSWTPAARERWGVASRVVSHNLPFDAPANTLGARATAFIDGLLPEGVQRVNRALELGIDPDDTYALLFRCGLDTAGAVTVTTADDPATGPAPELGDVLDAGEIARRLDEAARGRYRDQLTSISLPGVIPKIAVVRDASRRWRLPALGQASTWIIKQAQPPETIAADVVDTEALCLDLGRRCQVTDVGAEVLDLGGMRAIAVRRYDRLADGHRIHQEDLAQALGLNSREPDRKFQWGRQSPSWGHAAEVLRAGGGLLSPLARLLTFSFLVGNTDHHAKNISFMRHPDGSVALAPAYDVAVHLHHPGAHRFALDVAGERDVDVLTLTHVIEEITSWGVPRSRAVEAVVDVVADLEAAVAEIDHSAHRGVPSAAWDVIDSRVAQAGRLRR